MTTSTNSITIIPGVGQFLSEILGNTIVVLLVIAASACLPKTPYENYIKIGLAAICIALLCFVFTKYMVLNAYSWTIGETEIKRKHGIFRIQTDYIELYRVVDYKETQSLLQRIFRVKTVVIVSTDKSDPIMEIKGVPTNTKLVEYTRKLVEKNKKQNHVYEIANR